MIFDFDNTEINNNWLKAKRLMEKRDKGDKSAEAELKRMDDTEMVPIAEVEK